MENQDIALMCHLMRRAGFGESREEIEARVSKGYEATVEELLHPERQPGLETDVLYRANPEWKDSVPPEVTQAQWLYRMINNKHPLEEKIAVFWHSIFCVGNAKVEDGGQMWREITMFRKYGLGSFRTLLLQLSRDPAMLYFLDNNMSHKDAVNENWGRELLELFSMGVGNYTEDDVKAASRAFTGWTVTQRLPRYPYSRYEWFFKYDPSDHDDSEKTFLGQKGRWNGEDVVDIIARNPATAQFIARRLHEFFVSDVRDQAAINILADSYMQNDFEIRAVLRTLFTSDFFKNSMYTKVKSPAEAVVSMFKLAGDCTVAKPGFYPLFLEMTYMGQTLLNPPTVEGWHTGKEWIDSGTLVERVNFAAEKLGDTGLPGVRAIAERVGQIGKVMTPEQLVDACLDLMGPLKVNAESRQVMIDLAGKGGEIRRDERFVKRVSETLQLVVATQEYQFV